MSIVSTKQTQNEVLLGRAEFWERTDDETVGSSSTCTTVVISNQEPVPPYTEEELKSRVEAVYNASTDVGAASNLLCNIYLYGSNEMAGLTGRRSEAARRLHRFIEKHEKDHAFEIKTAISSVYKARKALEQVKVAKKEQEGSDDGTFDSALTSSSKSASLPAARGGASKAQKEQDVGAAANANANASGQDGNNSSWAKRGYSVSGSNDASVDVSAIADAIREDGCVEDHAELHAIQHSITGTAIVESNSADSTEKQRRKE